MILQEKIIPLKNNFSVTLRSPEPEDWWEMLDYLRSCSAETEFLTLYPEEVAFTEAEERELLGGACESENSMMLAAFLEGQVVGNVSVCPIGSQSKLRHRSSLGIALRKDFWGLGLGSILMEEAISFARQAGFEQLELEVSGNNPRAKRLYEKLGFVACGELPNGFKLKGGGYAPLISMVKLL